MAIVAQILRQKSLRLTLAKERICTGNLTIIRLVLVKSTKCTFRSSKMNLAPQYAYASYDIVGAIEMISALSLSVVQLTSFMIL